ncbi:MAG: Holliday junction resolvase RecU [Clostridia bacterium]|nr:Holliday junction resolvase RecU [Clostridia bacterium]
MTEKERRTAAHRYMGMKLRNTGANFEKLIDSACNYYRREGIADIEKTPEPMKPIKSIGGGKFIAVYTDKAQADYKGYLQDGKAVYFEAKATMTDRITQDRVTKNQTERLERAYRMGVEVFVLCCFNDMVFIRVPWKVWRNMKDYFGRKYIAAEDTQRAFKAVSFKPPGYLAFLE